MEKKIKVTKYIPSILVEYIENGNRSIVTSVCLYDDQKSASDAMEILIKRTAYWGNCKLISWKVFTKIIAL